MKLLDLACGHSLIQQVFFYQAWVIVMIPLLLVMLVVFYKFIVDLPGKYRWLFLISGGLFVFGALVLEMVGGYFRGDSFGNWKLINAALITFEEFFENVGIVVFIYTLLDYIKTNLPSDGSSFKVT